MPCKYLWAWYSRVTMQLVTLYRIIYAIRFDAHCNIVITLQYYGNKAAKEIRGCTFQVTRTATALCNLMRPLVPSPPLPAQRSAEK